VEADSRNICPCRAVSDKREYMARTIRPKIMRLLPEFLEPFPALAPHPVPWPGHGPANYFVAARAALAVDRSVAEVDWARPGTDAGMAMLRTFMAERLPRYHERNDPNADAVSLLSPWLHFGMISAQRVALEALRATAPAEARDSFVEELVVRRELADNFCLHAPDYDSVSCFPDWAARSLDKHRGDERPWLYGLDDLEGAATHDPLWNAAQRQMVRRGHMHGWLRMYWAKKILEWSATPEEALRAAIFLNDRYQLDGREANGYAGIAWALGGVHDRPWAKRPVFGSVRYMNFAGARRKFDVAAFVSAFGDAHDRELLTAMR
jgi:deoxyribodipyrimidine photo-lyase